MKLLLARYSFWLCYEIHSVNYVDKKVNKSSLICIAVYHHFSGDKCLCCPIEFWVSCRWCEKLFKNLFGNVNLQTKIFGMSENKWLWEKQKYHPLLSQLIFLMGSNMLYMCHSFFFHAQYHSMLTWYLQHHCGTLTFFHIPHSMFRYSPILMLRQTDPENNLYFINNQHHSIEPDIWHERQSKWKRSRWKKKNLKIQLNWTEKVNARVWCTIPLSIERMRAHENIQECLFDGCFCNCRLSKLNIVFFFFVHCGCKFQQSNVGRELHMEMFSCEMDEMNFSDRKCNEKCVIWMKQNFLNETSNTHNGSKKIVHQCKWTMTKLCLPWLRK